MPYPEGPCDDLCITDREPVPTGLNLSPWENIRGARLTNIHRYDATDGTYLVSLEGVTDPVWVHDRWVTPLDTPDNARKEWRDSKFSEFQRQMNYAAAFQRLMWRELAVGATKKRVGESVAIRSNARGIQTAFPSVWHDEWYPFCWSQKGVVVEETREFGADNELHRAYKVQVELPKTTFERLTMWWLSEDLE